MRSSSGWRVCTASESWSGGGGAGEEDQEFRVAGAGEAGHKGVAAADRPHLTVSGRSGVAGGGPGQQVQGQSAAQSALAGAGVGVGFAQHGAVDAADLDGGRAGEVFQGVCGAGDELRLREGSADGLDQGAQGAFALESAFLLVQAGGAGGGLAGAQAEEADQDGRQDADGAVTEVGGGRAVPRGVDGTREDVPGDGERGEVHGGAAAGAQRGQGQGRADQGADHQGRGGQDVGQGGRDDQGDAGGQQAAFAAFRGGGGGGGGHGACGVQGRGAPGGVGTGDGHGGGWAGRSIPPGWGGGAGWSAWTHCF
ncbi:hypothetical protein DEGR_08550 [Deinococcus grandis]|nr:hypothetical protein DEGR_08550 [Deinococcus grandis]